MPVLQMALMVLFGAILGSFLNVCIYRLPRGESIVAPSSYCTGCKRPIPLLHNIPIVSYLVLRGRCGSCHTRIPISYPLVEVTSAMLLLLVWWHFGLNLSFIHYSLLALLLLTISAIDLNHKLILNVLTLPGIVIGLISSTMLQLVSPLQAFVGMLLGGGFLWFIGVIGKGLFKKDSMGGGDIKLGAMIGAFIGPQVIVALFLSFFLAMPVVAIGLGSGRLRMGGTLPFGPFISASTVIIVLFGPALYDLYLSLFFNF